jgi:hypothetical protein
MPTTISTSPRAWRHPAGPTDRTSRMLACTALGTVGLLLAVLAVNFEIGRVADSGANSLAAATESVGASELGIP